MIKEIYLAISKTCYFELFTVNVTRHFNKSLIRLIFKHEISTIEFLFSWHSSNWFWILNSSFGIIRSFIILNWLVWSLLLNPILTRDRPSWFGNFFIILYFCLLFVRSTADITHFYMFLTKFNIVIIYFFSH